MERQGAKALKQSRRALAGYFLSKVMDDKKKWLHRARIFNHIAYGHAANNEERKRIQTIAQEMSCAAQLLSEDKLSKKTQHKAREHIESAKHMLINELVRLPFYF